MDVKNYTVTFILLLDEKNAKLYLDKPNGPVKESKAPDLHTVHTTEVSWNKTPSPETAEAALRCQM